MMKSSKLCETSNISELRRAKRAKRALIKKRRMTLFRKANELALISGGDLYILANIASRYYLFSSNDLGSWPPDRLTIVID